MSTESEKDLIARILKNSDEGKNTPISDVASDSVDAQDPNITHNETPVLGVTESKQPRVRRKAGRPKKPTAGENSASRIASKQISTRELGTWKDFAFELYRKGWSLKQIAVHPDVNISYHRLKNVAYEESWATRREVLQDKAVGITPDALEEHWRVKGEYTKDVIIEMVTKGRNILSCFQLFGFNQNEQDEWIGEDDDFERRLWQATRLFEFEMRHKIELHGMKDWRANQHLLETNSRLRDEYRPKVEEKQGLQITFQFKRESWDEIPMSLPMVDVTPKKAAIAMQSVIDVEAADVEKSSYKNKEVKVVPVVDDMKTAKQKAAEYNAALLKKIRGEVGEDPT